MNIEKDDMTIITKNAEAITQDEITVKFTSPQPSQEVILDIGGVKNAIASIDEEIAHLSSCIALLQSKQKSLTLGLARIQEATKNIALKADIPVKGGGLNG